MNTLQHMAYDEGIQEGSKQNSIEIAKNFLKMGLPIEQIAKGTNLSIEEIKKLKL